LKNEVDLIELKKEMGKDDVRFKKNIRNVLKMLICCQFEKFKKVKNLYNIAEEKFDELMNINNFIKENHKNIMLRKIILNKKEEILFDFLSEPYLSFENKKEEDSEFKDLTKIKTIDFENLYLNYEDIELKENRTELENKILEAFVHKMDMFDLIK